MIDSSKRTGRIWGFCDGTDVYIKYNLATGIQIADNIFLKLHVGRYPFFSFKDRNSSPVVLLPGFGLLGAAITAATATKAIASASKPYSSKDYSLCLITDKGKLNKRPLVSDIEKLVSTQPELLNSFEEKAGKYKMYDNPANVDYIPEEVYYETYFVLKEFLFKLNEGYSRTLTY